MVRSEGVKGRILMMYPTDPTDGNSYPLMYEKEKNTICERVKALCEKYKPKKVLEIGFGLGYTASTFQEYGVEEHTIIEAHPKIFKKAVKWAEQYKGNKINLINCFFQDYKYEVGSYDLILDDRFEICHDLNGIVTPRYTVKDKMGWGQVYNNQDRINLTE